MPIIRTPIQDDDGSGYTGTILNNVWKQEFYDQIDAFVKGGETPGVVTITNGGTNVFDVVLPTPRSFYYVRVNPASAPITIRTITAGRNGDLALVENVYNLGDGVVWCASFDTTGSGAPLANRVVSGSTPLGKFGSALYIFDGALGCWVLAQHDQGKAIRVPYSAANYTSPGSWTVAAGNVFFHDYQLLGNDLLISLAITNGMLSAAHGQLYAGGFPFTWAGSETTAMGMGYPSGLAGVNWGPCLVNNGGDTNKLLFQRCALDSWPAGPIFVTFRGTFQVT